ncbi:MAG: hypothetical protein M1819_000202 [Sarea resinae]|nr:MAG: hypothetical protein M1819_000202 [Sarea resinae]
MALGEYNTPSTHEDLDERLVEARTDDCQIASHDLQHQGASHGTQSIPRSAQRQPVRSSEEHEETDVSTRPRLTREQVWLLEKQFQAHHKPNSNIKRHLAEETGLSLQRVANWFQNRRAKAKQQRKQQEYEVLHANQHPSGGSYPEVFSPSFIISSEHFPCELDQSQFPGGSFGGFTDECGNTLSRLYLSNNSAHPVDLRYAHHSVQQGPVYEISPMGDLSEGFSSSKPNAEVHEGIAPYTYSLDDRSTQDISIPEALIPAPSFSEYCSSQGSSLSWPHPYEAEDMLQANGARDERNYSYAHSNQPPIDHEESFGAIPETPDSDQMQPQFRVQNFPPQLMPRQQQQLQQHCHPFSGEAQTEPSETELVQRSSYPPELHDTFNAIVLPQKMPDDVFKQPEAPLDLAARRKRPRPAALGNASLRGHAMVGSMPVSPIGKGSLLHPSSPMRRIRSTNNLNPTRGRMQNRVFSAQRSPFNASNFADAFGLSDERYETPRSASQMPSVSGSLAPPTPMSPLDMDHARSDRSSSMADHSSLYYPTYPGYIVPTTTETTSPPSTPFAIDMHTGMPQHQPSEYSSSPHSASGLLSSRGLSQASILPSEIISFPSTLYMPQPIYASPLGCGDSELTGILEEQQQQQQLQLQLQQSQILEQQHHYQSQARHRASEAELNGTANEPKRVPELLFHQYTPQQRAPPPPPPPAQSSPQRPKNYIFTNQGPEDF